MPLIKSPEEYNKILHGHKTKVFLAGGITGCADWQAEFLETMQGSSACFFNPRRDDFDVTNENMSSNQVEWEYRHIEAADIVLFWFPEETLCPITLYELGVQAALGRDIIVGCHPNYKRKFDVVKQLSLIRPEIKVLFSLSELRDQLI